MAFLDSFSKDAKIFDVFASRPDVYEPFVRMVERVTRGDSPFTRGQRELMGAFVSSLNACSLCVDIHTRAAEAESVDPVADDEKLAPVLALLRKLTESPEKVVAADVDAVRAAGWDDDAVHDAVLIACIAGFMNRFVFGLGIEADDAYKEAAGLAVHDRGYQSRFRDRLEEQDAEE